MSDDPHWVDQYVGQRIRTIRKQRGLSQEKLGEHVGITFQQIQKYEKGMNRVSASMLYDIADALDVNITTIMPDAEHPEQPLRLNGLDDAIHGIENAQQQLKHAMKIVRQLS